MRAKWSFWLVAWLIFSIAPWLVPHKGCPATSPSRAPEPARTRNAPATARPIPPPSAPAAVPSAPAAPLCRAAGSRCDEDGPDCCAPGKCRPDGFGWSCQR
jgi:hypothetical protein